MPFTQDGRPFSVSSDLGKDVLLFRRMTAEEQLGRLFEIRLDVLSENENLVLADLLGKGVTVTVETPAGSKRYLHGMATEFGFVGSEGKLALYRLTLRPWAWFLTRTADCRIYQQMTVPAIILKVFEDNGFSDFENKLTATYRQWDYCVQYRESDFHFISRLMEQEGIYYFFQHELGKHKLVLADSATAHAESPGYETIVWRPPGATYQRDHLVEWSIEQQVRSAKMVLDDFDFERPTAELESRSEISRTHAQNAHEIYDYPGEYLLSSDGEQYAKVRVEAEQAAYEMANGKGNARGLAVGCLFTLADFHRAEANRKYLVVATTYHLESEAYEARREAGSQDTCQCSVTAINSQQPYRSPCITPKHLVSGPQTAIVVGPSGDEIYTDKYGRVKVQFHWDRYGTSNENSSCWVRVAQLWAGKTWGGIHIPRIGQEVIVDFLEGDPDRPIITGRVYNADNMPPYTLPDNMTQSGVKSRSTKTGTGETFNELRFEDKKDAEEVYFHAEKDFNRVVENNDTLKVGFEKKDKGDQSIEIHNNQKLVVGNSESEDGSQTIEIWKNRTATVKEGNDTLTVQKGNRTTTVSQGNDDLTISQGDQTITISAGKNVTKAGTSIELTVGGSSIKIEPAKITLKAAQIVIQGDGTVEVKSPATTVSGDGSLTLKGGMVMIN